MKLSVYLKTVAASESQAAGLSLLAQFFGDVEVEVASIRKVDMERFSAWLAQHHPGESASCLRTAQEALAAYYSPGELTEAEVTRVIGAAPTDEWQGVLRLVLGHGVNLADALNLLRKNVQLSLLRYRRKCDGKDIQVELSSDTLSNLEALSSGRGGFLFPSLRHRKLVRLLEEVETIGETVGLTQDPKRMAVLRGVFVGKSN